MMSGKAGPEGLLDAADGKSQGRSLKGTSRPVGTQCGPTVPVGHVLRIGIHWRGLSDGDHRTTLRQVQNPIRRQPRKEIGVAGEDDELGIWDFGFGI